MQSIDAIIFDMGDTLRIRVPDLTTQNLARRKFLALVGKDGDGDAFFDELQHRHEAYSCWAQVHLLESPEEEIWTRWMLPEYPREKIAPVAKQLTLLWRERVGRAMFRPDAFQTVTALSQRGYRMAVISNTISSIDVPQSLERYGIARYMEIIILSSTSCCRKPDPEIFWQATRAMQIKPSRCAYLGDRISRDVVGSRNAGFAMAILIEPLGKPRLDEQDQTAKPDKVIHELSELLNIFPARNNS